MSVRIWPSPAMLGVNVEDWTDEDQAIYYSRPILAKCELLMMIKGDAVDANVMRVAAFDILNFRRHVGISPGPMLRHALWAYHRRRMLASADPLSFTGRMPTNRGTANG